MIGFKAIKKHRWKMLSGWLAFELVSVAIAIPAMANLTDRVELSVPQIVIVETLERGAGQHKFKVASNAAFAVISEGRLGEFSVSVEAAGVNSQVIGASQSCAVSTSTSPTRIFTARGKTAARRGSRESQSVTITVAYDAAVTPKLSIAAMDNAPALLALPCAIGEG